MRDIKAPLAVIFLILEYAQALDNNCTFTISVTLDNTFYVYSPGYGEPYPAGIHCLWTVTCPTNYNIRLECSVIDLPKSESCTMDRLAISRTGDPQLTSAEQYCGQDAVDVVSSGQQLCVGFISSQNSSGGRFNCKATAQRASILSATKTLGRVLGKELGISNLPRTCNCGYRKMNRIVGGKTTEPNEFTMMAVIFNSRSSGSLVCGGVIISDKHILTAGHCVFQKTASALLVIVGEHDTRYGRDTNYTRGFGASNYTIHPEFDDATHENDVAIIKLNKTISFNEYVGPVCLPFKYGATSFAGETATMLGWGTVSHGGSTSVILQAVNVSVITQSLCQSTSRYTIHSSHLCTSAANGKGSCQADSGGPVLYMNRTIGRLYSVGIISSGISCTEPNNLGINMRVTSFLDFILTYAPYDYCII